MPEGSSPGPSRAPHPSSCREHSEKGQGGHATAEPPPPRTDDPPAATPQGNPCTMSQWHFTRQHGCWFQHLPDHTGEPGCGVVVTWTKAPQKAREGGSPVQEQEPPGQQQQHVLPGSLDENHRAPSAA